jgi:hypothetical protein
MEWHDDLHLSEGRAAAAEADTEPIHDDVYIGTTRYPFVGQHPPRVIGRSEAQAKAALLKHWRWANQRGQRLAATDAKAHSILMGFDPADFPEKFEGLTFKVRCWEDLRRIYRATVYPVAFGEVWVDGRKQGTGDLVFDSIEYLKDDERWFDDEA